MSLHAAYASSEVERDRILADVHPSGHQRSGYSDTMKPGRVTIIHKPDVCALLESQRCMPGISRTRHTVRRLYVPVPSASSVQSGRCADQTP